MALDLTVLAPEGHTAAMQSNPAASRGKDTAAAGTQSRSTRRQPAEPAAIAEAACCLHASGLVAFPTETVYGLGADARNSAAVARLYAAKGRPSFNPLIAHVADHQAALRLGMFNADAERLAAAFWPGPLTLVVRRRPDDGISELAAAGLDSLALRVPAHPVAHALLRDFGAPIVAPSANRSGHVSPTRAEHVLSDLNGRIDLVLDGGATPVGVESTIVSCLDDQPVLLRPGGVPREAIETALGGSLMLPDADGYAAPHAPGMLESHYAPKARLRLGVTRVEPREALLAFGPILPSGAEHASAMLSLSAAGDTVEAAANLFSHLRALDACGFPVIAIMPIPATGLGEAINDRLQRAAAGR